MKYARLDPSDNRLYIYFRFPLGDPEFNTTKELIKSLPDRRWLKSKKAWSAPNLKIVRSSLREWGFDVNVLEDDRIIRVSGLDERLYPFQVIGVKRIVGFEGRCLLSMDMGLGKTATSLSYYKINPDIRPVVMVVPASVKINWYREIKNWMKIEDERVVIISGQSHFPCKGASLIIINYDILSYHVDYLVKSVRPKALIVDECQYVKNLETKRSQAVLTLAKSVESMVALSGTPITNRPSEFWPVLHMLKPQIWGARSSFLNRFCGSFQTGYKGATHTRELNQILNDEVMYRVLKKDVLHELPDKVHTIVPFKIDLREYRRAEWDFEQFLKTSTSKQMAQALQMIGHMRDVAAVSKLEQSVEWISDFLESGEKLVVFAIHYKIIDRLMDKFGSRAVKLDGRNSMTEKDHSVQKFQSDSRVQLFVGNVEAAGIGIDGLQNASSNVAFLELPWVPASIDQASDRLHRFGQKGSVNVYYHIAEETIEERIASALDGKRQVLRSVLDGTDAEEGSLIMGMLNEYRQRQAS